MWSSGELTGKTHSLFIGTFFFTVFFLQFYWRYTVYDFYQEAGFLVLVV